MKLINIKNKIRELVLRSRLCNCKESLNIRCEVRDLNPGHFVISYFYEFHSRHIVYNRPLQFHPIDD